jgi:hypothetical protein
MAQFAKWHSLQTCLPIIRAVFKICKKFAQFAKIRTLCKVNANNSRSLRILCKNSHICNAHTFTILEMFIISTIPSQKHFTSCTNHATISMATKTLTDLVKRTFHFFQLLAATLLCYYGYKRAIYDLRPESPIDRMNINSDPAKIFSTGKKPSIIFFKISETPSSFFFKNFQFFATST